MKTRPRFPKATAEVEAVYEARDALGAWEGARGGQAGHRRKGRLPLVSFKPVIDIGGARDPQSLCCAPDQLLVCR